MDENLDVLNESTQQHECISGSTCVDNIRRRLSPEVERRMFALVRSANGSTRDLQIYHEKAHGFLPKAPIRKEKVKEVLAPLWLKRFPPSDFPDSIDCDDDSLSTSASLCSEVACSTEDIAQKLLEIDELFRDNIHVSDWRRIHDNLHMLKGDLLTMDNGASIISSLGMINLMLIGHSMGLRMDSDAVLTKWQNLRDHISSVLSAKDARDRGEKTNSLSFISKTIRRGSLLNKGIASSFVSTSSNKPGGTRISSSKGFLTDSFVSISSNVSGQSNLTDRRSNFSGSRRKGELSSSFVSESSHISCLSESATDRDVDL